VFGLLNRKFQVDELYAASFGRLADLLSAAWMWLDTEVIARVVSGTGVISQVIGRASFILDDSVLNDGADALASGTAATGNQARRATNGKVQDYIAVVFAGVVLLGALYLYGVSR
jgi:NADH-quinone oxidoreductase subunit L